MKFRSMAAALALALGTVVGGGAQAATVIYDLTVDGCTGGCIGSGQTDVGTVTVNDAGGKLAFTVALNSGVTFNTSGNSPTHHSFVFDFGSTALDLTGLSFGSPSTLSAGFSGLLGGGPFTDSPFGGNWDYVINYTGDAKQGSGPSSLSFTLSDSLNNLSLALLDAGGTYNNQPIFVAADVFANGNTGNVGATGGTPGGVPEPATWGLMIMGVFAMGAAMRARRKAMTLA